MSHANNGSDGPEVDISRDAPIPVHSARPDEKQSTNVPWDDSRAHYAPDNTPMHLKEPSSQRRSPRWAWWLGIVLAALISLGAGIGIGYAVGDKTHSNSASASSSNSLPPTTVTIAPDATSTSTTFSSAVTTGWTGIAPYSCNDTPDNNQYFSYSTIPNQVFTQECHTDYPNGGPQWNSTTATVKDISSVTVYSFQACMDLCAIYNSQQSSNAANGGVDACQAVLYNANLSLSHQYASGSCFLKTARGQRHNDSTFNYQYYATAYITGDI